MRVMTSGRFGRWTRGVGLLALGGLAWAAFVPGGLFWSAVAVAGLVGSAVATALVVRSRSVPSLAQVIASAESETVVVPFAGGSTGGAGLRSRGAKR
ncbi:MAG TPA: hypothetical protein VMX54_09610 [Vicinamibacteria bacterium]|nr:hypothetical protein [Vicinamibacteria bacterium]